MEPPPFYHHRRYASPPSSENPNFYNHHHHHHRLPPPPPPPPSHPRPPLPLPLLSPTPSQFSFRPHPYPPSVYPPPHSFRHSPARDPASRSLPFYDQNSSRWSDLPPPPPPPRVHHQLRPPSPVGNYVDDYGRDFRFRGEGGYKDREFRTTDYVDDEKYRYRSSRFDFERNSSSRFERDVGIADSQGVGKVRSYDSYNDLNDDPRRGYSRPGNGNEYMDGGVGLRRELVESGYNYVGRLKSKIVGHSQEFFNRSPMKPQVVQKKSALLRIGKTNTKNQHWNRGHEDSRYSRGYYDDEESDLCVDGNFRGKVEYDFVGHELQMDVKREKSPMELDVSFKSNALVAKAINPPSCYVPESDAFVGIGNRSKKVGTTDSPRKKLNDYSVKAPGPSLPPLSSERSHEKLKEKAAYFKAGSYDDGLYSPSKSSVEKVINSESNDDTSTHAFLSASDKDVGQLAGKMSVSDRGAHFVDGSTGGMDSMRGIAHDQDGDLTAPGVVDLQGPGKQNCDANSLRPLDVHDKLSDLDNSSTGSLSTTSQLEKVEGVRHLRDKISSGEKCATNDVISSQDVNIASEGVHSDAKEDFSSSVPVSLEHSVSVSALSTQVNKLPHGDPSHVDKLIDNEQSRLSSDGGLVQVQNLSEILVSKGTSATFQSHNVDDGSKHPGLNECFLAETSLVGEARISVNSNDGPSSLKEYEAHDTQMETSTPNRDDVLIASNFDQGFCISSGNVTDIEMASTDAMPKESPQHLVSNLSNGNVNINDCPDGNLSVSLVGTHSPPMLEKLLVHEDAGNHLSSGSIASCTTNFSNSLENRTLTGLGFLDHSNEQSIVDGETSLFFDLAEVGKKRKVTEGQLDVHVVKASKLARSLVDSEDGQDESFILPGKIPVSVEIEDGRDNEQKNSGKCSIKEGLTVLDHQVKGSKTRGEFSSIQTSPVFSELIPTPEVSKPSAETSSIIEQDLNLTADSVTHSWRDETIFNGLSSHFEAPVILLQENSVAGGSYDGSLTGDSKHDRETSYQLNEEKISVAVSSSDLKSNSCLHIEGYQGNSTGSDDNQKPSLGGVSCADFLPMDDSAASSDSQCPTSSTDGQIDSLPDTLSNMGSPDDLSDFVSDVFSNSLRMNQVSHSCQGKGNMSTDPILAGDDMSIRVEPPLHSSKGVSQSGVIVIPDPALNSKAATSSIWNPSKVSRKIDPLLKTSSSVSNRLNSSVVKSKYSAAIKVAPSSHIAKPRTWLRTLNAQPLVSEPKSQNKFIHNRINSNKDVSKVQGSYVRRGNTLVRKSPLVNDSNKVLTSQSSVSYLNTGVSSGRLDIDTGKQQTAATLAGSNSCLEKLKTSPLVGSIRSSSCTSSNPLDLAVTPQANPVSNYCPGETSDPCKSAQDVDTKRSLEEDMRFSEANQCETVSRNYLDCSSNGDGGDSGKKIFYLKRKSNQLVAASNTSDVLLQSRELPHVFSSDNYVKRRKNQLIRTSLNGNVKHGAVIDGKSSCLQQDSQNHVQVRNSSKRLSGSIKKKFSLVWTLNGTLSSRKDGSSGRLQRVLPNFFRWKRASSWTNHMHCLSSFSNDSSVIGQKLRLTRKREAIYKRSLNGFSLCRSKVLGVGGSNLKWSKSMEKNSRKANTEATLAVAAAEKQKKAQNLASFTLSKSRNYVSRERIFRIGSERYKMDPTRRTLQRISDEQSSCSDQSEKKEKKVYVPSRLLIGNNEYVRVGNGNKLVRDPKRRTRILANEKVRWSLHTARLRLAKKKQYCQFFTRFGKCHKDDGKCPYIHDPSKIAVCTKFLHGSCFNLDCKLTHKVIPERMQDCSYFLQGLCSNGSCPYRHVNVNKKAPVCEGFLRGYCADGDECLKKHTHVCPEFEATGSCQVPDCKLHHPKKKVIGKKRRVSNLQRNARGRYFGSPLINVGPDLSRAYETISGKGDGTTRTSETFSGKGDGSMYSEEVFGAYISLDTSIDEMELVFEPRREPVCDHEETLSDMEMAEADEFTKPVKLMNKTMLIHP